MKSDMEKVVITLKSNYIKNLSLRSSTGNYNDIKLETMLCQ